MAVLAKYGNFNVPINHPNTQTITGVGFQPKAIIFFSHYIDGSISTDAWENPIGFATSTADTAIVGINSSAYGDGSYMRDTTNAIYNGLSTSSGVEEFSAQLTSMNADGFTVSWNAPSFSNNYPPKDVHYLAIGGDDVINAKVMNVGALSGSGNKVYTGLGFQPNSMLFLTQQPNPVSASIGAANGTSQYLFGGGINGVSGGAYSMLQTGYCIGTVRGNNGSQQTMGTLVSFDSNGFTINHATAATNTTLDVLALQLTNPLALGTFVEPTSASAQVMELGKTPKAMWFLSRHQLPSTTSSADHRWSQGVTDGTSQYSVTLYRPNNKASSAHQRYNKAINLIEGSYVTPTYPATADVAFDPTGFTATWSSVHATQREVMYIGFVENKAGVIATGSYNLALDSAVAIQARRTRQTSVAASGDLALEVKPVAKRQSSYTINGDLTLTAEARRLRDGILTLTTEIDIEVNPQRRRASAHAMDAELSLSSAGQAIRTAAYALGSELTFDYDTEDYQLGVFTLSAQSALAYLSRVDRKGAFSIAAQANLSYTQQRRKNSSYSFESGADVVVSAIRIRGSQFLIVSDADLDYLADRFASGRFALSADAILVVSPNALMVQEFIMPSEFDLTYRAKPKLVKTYEQAFARVAETTAQGKQKEIIRVIVHPQIKGKEY